MSASSIEFNNYGRETAIADANINEVAQLCAIAFGFLPENPYFLEKTHGLINQAKEKNLKGFSHTPYDVVIAWDIVKADDNQKLDDRASSDHAYHTRMSLFTAVCAGLTTKEALCALLDISPEELDQRASSAGSFVRDDFVREPSRKLHKVEAHKIRAA